MKVIKKPLVSACAIATRDWLMNAWFAALVKAVLSAVEVALATEARGGVDIV